MLALTWAPPVEWASGAVLCLPTKGVLTTLFEHTTLK